MLSVNITLTDDISKMIKRQQDDLKKLPAKSITKYRELTPIRSGNARRNTSLIGDNIKANYPYAGKLDSGSSNQAPEGMTTPFNNWFDKEVKKIFRK